VISDKHHLELLYAGYLTLIADAEDTLRKLQNRNIVRKLTVWRWLLGFENNICRFQETQGTR